MKRPAFHHDRSGTPEETWAASPRWTEVAPFQLPTTLRRLVVIGAHPDDETLGAGGLIHTAARAGWSIDVISASAGERSHPESPSHTADQLAARRRSELDTAISHLASTAGVSCLGLPDGRVAEHHDEVVARLVEVVGSHGHDVLVCAPWRHDGHPDHEAVGRAAAVAASRTDAELLEYPIWFWHWGTDVDLPWPHASTLSLDSVTRAAKRAAVAAHESQVQALSDQPGDEVMLGGDVLAHFERDREVFLADGTAIDDDALDVVHRERPDPWQVDSHYERRKRAITLASLPRERYVSALEVGCSVGALAVDLASRCDRLLAVDASPTAIGLAQRRTATLSNVDVRLARIPEQWPDSRFDLVSISEIGYFLSPRQLGELVDRTRTGLARGGHVLLCHWRHQPVGWPLAGPAVHEAFLASGLDVLVEHHEPDFLLHVLAAPS